MCSLRSYPPNSTQLQIERVIENEGLMAKMQGKILKQELDEAERAAEHAKGVAATRKARYEQVP